MLELNKYLQLLYYKSHALAQVIFLFCLLTNTGFIVYNYFMKIIECVPNISLSARPEKLRRIINAVQNTPGALLLHTDENPSANRTVLTFAGEPGAVLQAANTCIKTALQEIDMRAHRGAHPRLGAVDVCPLVPVQGITLEETALLARTLARQAALENNLPVYLYEAAAQHPERKNLADVRRGEYESLPQKLQSQPPDFGPTVWDEHTQKTGACIIGARNILIAFNINLNTQDAAPAKQIAAAIREKNGGLKCVKAIGWYMENFGRAQVSCNLTDYTTTGPAQVFEECKRQAARLGVKTTGCELVGLIPRQALLNAGKFYARDKALPPQDLIKLAVEKLNLNDVKPFRPHQQILEELLEQNQRA